jgi:hypothetical protein
MGMPNGDHLVLYNELAFGHCKNFVGFSLVASIMIDPPLQDAEIQSA